MTRLSVGGEELKQFWPFVLTNKMIGSTLDFSLKDQLKGLKPDIVFRNHEKIVIMDVACPYDLYLNELHDRKQEIYSEVNFEITADVRQAWTNLHDCYFEYLFIRFDCLIIYFDYLIIG